MLMMILKRMMMAVPSLIGVVIVTFLLTRALPGDPAAYFAGPAATTEAIQQIRVKLGLDKPLYIQYARFAKGLVPWPGWFLTEDVYYSYGNFVAVKEEIWRRLPVTITLAVGAAVIWLALGIPIGIVSGVKRGSFWDRAGMLFALIGVSMPVF